MRVRRVSTRVLSVCLTDWEVQTPSLHDAKINYERLTLSSFAGQFVLKKKKQAKNYRPSLQISLEIYLKEQVPAEVRGCNFNNCKSDSWHCCLALNLDYDKGGHNRKGRNYLIDIVHFVDSTGCPKSSFLYFHELKLWIKTSFWLKIS